jgi:signal recognition particle GTPase
MVEIGIVLPKKMKIQVPQCLFEELEANIREENLSAVVTEALTEELKKVRFRMDLEKASAKNGLQQSMTV